MHDEGRAARLRHRVDEPVEALLRVLVVDADAAFDRDGQRRRFAHGGDALGDEIGLGHEAGAEPPRLHAVRGTADIEVDLVIAVLGADPRRRGELLRIAAAELKRDADARPAIEAEHAARDRRGAPPRPSPSRYRATSAARSAAGNSGSGGRSTPSSARRRNGGSQISKAYALEANQFVNRWHLAPTAGVIHSARPNCGAPSAPGRAPCPCR